MAALLYFILARLRPANWTYRNVLIFVGMTARPAILYATPIQWFLPFEAARLVNIWFLGLILPSYYDKVFAYFEDTGEVLLEIPKKVEIEIIASFEMGACDTHELNLGDPYQEPPKMTVREHAIRYFGSEAEWLECNGYEDDDFDRVMGFWEVIDAWVRRDSSNARAYRLLGNLDLGPQLTGVDAVGEIQFIDGPCPGSDYLGAHGPTQLDISLLQKRLNDLETGIRVVIE